MARWVPLVALCLSVSLHAQELDELVQRAKFIFAGDVVKLGSSSLPSVPPAPDTAVVRVRKVLTGEALLGGFAGREITVTLQKPARYENVVFFTNVVVYGESLAVAEVAPPRAGVSGEDVAAALRRNEQRAAEERKERAAVIVAGTVVDVRTLEKGPQRTEHEPRWALAVVRVEKVLKGSAGPTVEVLFPASHDEKWRKSPKFAKGDAGVFILHRDEQGLTALSPLDFQRGAR